MGRVPSFLPGSLAAITEPSPQPFICAGRVEAFGSEDRWDSGCGTQWAPAPPPPASPDTSLEADGEVVIEVECRFLGMERERLLRSMVTPDCWLPRGLIGLSLSLLLLLLMMLLPEAAMPLVGSADFGRAKDLKTEFLADNMCGQTSG